MFFNLLKNSYQKLHHLINKSDCVLCLSQVEPCQLKDAPKLSLECRKQPHLICHFCHQRLPFLAHSCPVCAMPLTASATNPNNNNGAITQQNISLGGQVQNNNAACGACLTHAPDYHQTVAAFHYEAPISDFISKLKFNAQLQYLPLLNYYLLSALKQHYSKQTLPELICPIPLHAKKLRQRGFNQALLIANFLAKRLKIPLIHREIKRTRYTQSQSTLNAKQRRKNLTGAFALTQATTFKHKHIAIVDDVVTTGTTVNELTQLLLKAGASRVDIWCVARAFPL